MASASCGVQNDKKIGEREKSAIECMWLLPVGIVLWSLLKWNCHIMMWWLYVSVPSSACTISYHPAVVPRQSGRSAQGHPVHQVTAGLDLVHVSGVDHVMWLGRHSWEKKLHDKLFSVTEKMVVFHYPWCEAMLWVLSIGSCMENVYH